MRRFLAALVLCSIVPASHAALVDNGTYTTDTVTNLDWLDLTETNYFPYGVVSSQLGSGGLWDGWRYATNAEATNLFQTLGFTIAGTNGAPIGSAPAGFSSALSLFVNLFGNTLGEADNVGTYFGAFGVTAQGTDPGDHQSMGAYTYGFSTGFILATAPCCDQSDSLGDDLHRALSRSGFCCSRSASCRRLVAAVGPRGIGIRYTYDKRLTNVGRYFRHSSDTGHKRPYALAYERPFGAPVNYDGHPLAGQGV